VPIDVQFVGLVNVAIVELVPTHETIIESAADVVMLKLAVVLLPLLDDGRPEPVSHGVVVLLPFTPKAQTDAAAAVESVNVMVSPLNDVAAAAQYTHSSRLDAPPWLDRLVHA